MRKRSSNPAFRVANNGRCSTAEWSGSRQQLLDKRAWMLRRLRFPPASSRSNTEPSSDVTTSRGPKKGGGEVECDHQKKVVPARDWLDPLLHDVTGNFQKVPFVSSGICVRRCPSQHVDGATPYWRGC
jgi:hypothetical protein